MAKEQDNVVDINPRAKGKTIFCDFALAKFEPVIDKLQNDGVEIKTVSDAPKFLETLAQEPFDVCVINLLVGGMGPFELISNVRAKSKDPDIRIIVISRQVHKANIQNTIKAGANDFVADPFEVENLYHRILYHLTPKKILDPLGYEGLQATEESWPFINLMLEASEILSKTERGKEHDAFLKLVKAIADLLQSNRTSLMVVEQENNTGVVLATSDDPNFIDFPVSLHKYPEVLHVMHTGNFVLIEDVSQNALTHKISQQVKKISIGSLMVLPIRFQGELTGVLTVRRPRATGLPSMQVVRVLQAISNTMAAYSNMKYLLRRIYKDYSPKAV